MKQGEIYWANLDPTQDSEQAGLRPVVIVSGNTMNENFPVILACPITKKIKNYPGCVGLVKNKTNNLKQDGEIISFQIRSLSKKRLTKKIGTIKRSELKSVISGLNQVLIY